MRHGRAKQARKTLQFFQRSIGLRPPYPVLVDGTFVVAFFSHKLPMATRVERLLQTQALHWLTTRSVVEELATLANKTTDAEMSVVLRESHAWVQQHCRVVESGLASAAATQPLDTTTASAATDKGKNNNKKDAAKNKQEELSDASRDMLAVLKDCNGIMAANSPSDPTSSSDDHDKVSSPLLLASQDEALLHAARQTGSVPVIRLARGTVLLLEQPSSVAQQHASAEERQKWTVRGSLQEQEKVLVHLVKQQERQQQKPQQQGDNSGGPYARTSRYKRKAKGPNPLSCKSKKKKST
jgi:rRNA-processing protein FCF1